MIRGVDDVAHQPVAASRQLTKGWWLPILLSAQDGHGEARDGMTAQRDSEHLDAVPYEVLTRRPGDGTMARWQSLPMLS